MLDEPTKTRYINDRPSAHAGHVVRPAERISSQHTVARSARAAAKKQKKQRSSEIDAMMTMADRSDRPLETSLLPRIVRVIRGGAFDSVV